MMGTVVRGVPGTKTLRPVGKYGVLPYCRSLGGFTEHWSVVVIS